MYIKRSNVGTDAISYMNSLKDLDKKGLRWRINIMINSIKYIISNTFHIESSMEKRIEGHLLF